MNVAFGHKQSAMRMIQMRTVVPVCEVARRRDPFSVRDFGLLAWIKGGRDPRLGAHECYFSLKFRMETQEHANTC